MKYWIFVNKFLLLLVMWAGISSQGVCQIDKNKEVWFTDIKQAELQADRVYNLDLSGQSLDSLPDIISTFKNVRFLKLSDNNISSLNGRLKQLTSLVYLELSGNKFKTLDFSEFCGSQASIVEVWLRDNQLTAIDTSINCLKNLSSLNIGNNRLVNLPAGIILPRLKKLSLDNNFITEQPKTLHFSPKIAYLNLYGNAIEKIYFEKYFRNITYLNLGDNPLISMQFEIIPSKLTTLILDWVDLSEFDLQNLPKSIQVLSMEHCNLNRIDAILYLINLKELSLIQNNLTELPSGLRNLPKLRKLWIGGNSIFQQLDFPPYISVVE